MKLRLDRFVLTRIIIMSKPNIRLEDMTEPELRAYTKKLMNMIDDRLPEGAGFVLLFFPGGTNHNIWQYASNCERSDMIPALRTTADRLERGQHVPREGE
jgi:hypothetical protein